ncbi:winged helix-turn-helix transcriptional regulator [Natrialbaceae archaeon A-CW3]
MVICSLAVAGTGTAVALVDTSSGQTGEVDDAGSSALLEVGGLVLDDELEGSVNETTDTTNDTVNETTDTTNDTVNETTDTTNDTVNETTDTTNDTVNETTDTTNDTVNETTDTTNDTTEEIDDTVNDTTEKTDDTTDDTTETLEETTESLDETTDTIEDTADETTDTVDDTLETVDDTVDDTGETIEQTTNETIDSVNDTVETVDDTVDDTGETLEETTTTITDTTTTLLESTEVDATVRTESELLDLETSLAANVTTEDATDTDDEEAVADEDTARGPLGVGTPEPSSGTQTAVNGVLAGLLGVVAVSSMGAGAGAAGAGAAGAGAAGAGAGTAGSAVANWTGTSQLRRWWNLLRDVLSIPLAALLRYSRYDDSDPLENDRRNAIFDAVTAEPGLYLSEVSDRSDVPLSTVRHHVRILEEEKLVTSIKVDGKRRYFPIDADDVELHAALAEPTRRRLLEELATLGQAPNGELADALDRDPSTISHHLSKLEEAGLVVREREGRSVVNELSPAATTALLDAEARRPRPQPVPADD